MVMFTLIDTKGKGQGEFIRLVLAEAQLKFEDRRVTADEAETVKADSPTGSLPVLDSAGTYISEVNAIARYLGSLYHLYGANAKERAQVDQVLDVALRLVHYFHASFDDSIKGTPMETPAKSLRDYGLRRSADLLGHLEKQLVANGGAFFSGSKTSIADIGVYFFFTYIASVDADFAAVYAKHPALKKHAQAVAASPRIAAYLKA